MTNEEAIIQLEYRKDFATPMQIKAIDKGIEALKTLNATSNGELIKSLFPNAKWWVNEDNEIFTDYNGKRVYLDLDWWNSPYRREND